MPEHLTVEELAERWRKPPAWIRKQAGAGNIPGAWKLGRQWRFNALQIESYEQSQEEIQQQHQSKNVRAEHPENAFALTPISRKRQRRKNKP